MRLFVSGLAILMHVACSAFAVEPEALATTAPGWHLEVVAPVDQSYAGWDVEIGDADNDGQNEILTTGCPDSRLYLFKKTGGAWETRLLADNLAQTHPGMGLAVKVADLNGDKKNELVLGTGQEADATAYFYVMSTDGKKILQQTVSHPTDCNKSAYTHDLAMADLDKDGVCEVISAYCGGGEIIRYDLSPTLDTIQARKIHNLSGSGEEAILFDVDNDGALEFITANGFRKGQARLEIFEFDDNGEMIVPPRIVLDGPAGQPAFYVSAMPGDLDNDGKNELAVGWKLEQKINKATLEVYRIGDAARCVATLEKDTEDLDMAYFEKMMAIADADNDGKNELVISTRGDNKSEFITSGHLGRVYMYRWNEKDGVARTQLADFDDHYAESSWLAVGDADNDGKNEIALATGKGDRTQPGTSYVVLLKK